MIPLVASALAVDCAEIANMAEAGVPAEAIVARMNDGGPPIDEACLAAHHVDPALLAAAARLRATRPVRPVPVSGAWSTGPSPRVVVELECGSLRATGHAAPRVALDGRGDDRARLAALPSESGLALSVVDRTAAPGDDPAALPRYAPAARPDRAEPPCADLSLAVPRGARLVVRSTRADLDVRFVDGPLELTSHFGRVEVVGATDELVVRTTGGDVHADTGARHVDVQTVGGLVHVGAGPESRLTVSSISGPIWIWGGPIRRLRAESVSGDLHLDAAFAPSAHGELVTHKGNVLARVPPGQLSVASHEGRASAPPRLVRPDGPTARANSDSVRLPGLERLPPDTASLWAPTPARWWFADGAVVSSVIRSEQTDFTLEASSFSGDVAARVGGSFAGPTGPIVAAVEGARERLEACARAQVSRHPGARGHAVATVHVEPDGMLRRVSAAATADAPAAVVDGAFASCVERALQGVSWPAVGAVELRWPVAFPASGPASTPASPMVESRP